MDDLRQARIDKLINLEHSPWECNEFETNTSVQEMIRIFERPDWSVEEIIQGFYPTKIWSFIGRIHSKRGSGKIMFLDVFQEEFKIQLFLEKNSLGEEYDILKKTLDNGDVIGISGIPFRTQAGELTIKVSSCQILAKCLIPIPFGKAKDGEHFDALGNVEEQQRKRHLHLIVNPEEIQTFKQRSLIVRCLRSELEINDFLEVETPVLQPIRGGANAQPFSTHHNSLNQQMFLRIAPELYLKRLLVAGFSRVFEIGKNFRNEGIDTTHNPEFSMLEAYAIGKNYLWGMEFVEKLLQKVSDAASSQVFSPSESFTRIKFLDALHEIGLPLAASFEDAKQFAQNNHLGAECSHLAQVLDLIFKKMVIRQTQQPTFFYDYPIETSPLAKKKIDEPHLVERFQLVCQGIEVVNGFSELNHPFEQLARFEEQTQNSKSGDAESMPMDLDFVEALEMGMPPSCGFGIGIERLVMLLVGKSNIREVILFPTLRNAGE